MRSILACLVCLCLAGICRAQVQPTMADIRKVYAEKQKKMANVQVRWTTDRLVPKGAYRVEAKRKALQGDISEHPPTDSHIPGQASLLFIGNTFQYEMDDQAWDYKSRCFSPQNYLSAFDGKKGIARFNIPHLGSPSVNERAPGSELNDLNDLEIFPVTFALRGDAPSVCRDGLDVMELSGRNIPIGNGFGVELIRRTRSADLLQRFIMDPKKEFSLVKYLHEVNGSVIHQLDVTCEKNSEFGWLPADWTLVSRKKNAISGTFQAKRARYEAVAPTTPVFPKYEPGMQVIDTRGPQPTVHIVLPDGNDGPTIPLHELRTTDDLLPKPNRFWHTPWIYVGLSTIVILSTVLYMGVRRKYRRDPTISALPNPS